MIEPLARQLLRVPAGTLAPDDRVRQTLVDSLYRHPMAMIAFGQLLLVMVPLCVALALRGDGASWALAMALMLLAAGIISAIRMFHAVLRSSIAAADNSAQLAERIQQLARTDVVTGLLNRVGIDQVLIERAQALRPGEKLALLWFDLDRFKEINDTHGHQTGDRVLAEIGQRLAIHALPDAALARFGGDEFVVVCAVEGQREARRLAEKLLAAVTAPMELEDGSPDWHQPAKLQIEIGTSIGAALMPDHGADIETLLQNADLALYEAKRGGRSQMAL
jgi:diguanylate cyclase (GGDEF)-like protein